MAKVDLKDAYFMIPMAQEDRKFVRFQWRENLPLKLLAIRAVMSSLGLYQDHESGNGNPAGVGTAPNYLYR